MRFLLPVQRALVWAGGWGRGADAEAHQGAKGAMTKGGAKGSGPLTPPRPGGAWARGGVRWAGRPEFIRKMVAPASQASLGATCPSVFH